MKNKIRVGIIGVGNCASSLVQGIEFYRDANENDLVPGLMHVDLGGYHVRDIEFSAAFDVGVNKVGRDLSEAIFAEPNNTINFAEVPKLGVKVHRGMTHDGLGKYLKRRHQKIARLDRRHHRHSEEDARPMSSFPICLSVRRWRRNGMSSKFSRPAALSSIAFRFSSPRSRYWQRRFEERELPIIGDDIKSQVGATIAHRVLTNLFRDRGVRLDRTYQLNFGGNTDFMNMLERERLESKKISKTQAVTSQLGHHLPAENVHVGPSDYVPWLADRKWCYIRMEGTTFGNVPIELRTEVGSVGFAQFRRRVIDAVRCAKLALDRGMSARSLGRRATS